MQAPSKPFVQEMLVMLALRSRGVRPLFLSVNGGDATRKQLCAGRSAEVQRITPASALCSVIYGSTMRQINPCRHFAEESFQKQIPHSGTYSVY